MLSIHQKRATLKRATVITLALPGFCIALSLSLFLFPLSAHADNFPILGILHAGGRPEALAVDSRTHMLYIAYESPGLIVGFDPISGLVRWRRPLDDTATDVQVDSTTHRVYATAVSFRNGRSTLSILDGATGHILSILPAGTGDNSIALDSKRRRVYIASGDTTVYQYAFLSGWGTGEIETKLTRLHIGSHPDAVAVNTRLGRLYVADGPAHQVTVVDENSDRTLASLQVAALPLPPLRVDEATGRVYVVCSTGQELDVIDGNANKVIAHIPVAPYPEGIAINTATGRIYVADEGNLEGGPGDRGSGTTVTVIDGQSLNLLGTLDLGPAPDGAVADPGMQRVYVALEDSSAVVELSDSTDIPLKLDTTLRQTIVTRRTLFVLRQATIITIIVMLLTMVGATLVALLRQRRARESLQTPPVAVSSRSGRRSLPQ